MINKKAVICMKLITKAFIYNDPAPTPECHASTVVALEGGDAIAAWFGGTRENSPDVLIWYSRREGGIWSEPKSIPSQQPIQHWNPVLFQAPDGTVYLFYKVGTPIPQWKTMFVRSHDLGKTWTAPEELVENDVSGGRGPVKNKPIMLSNGTLLAPASVERDQWRCFADIFDGSAWRKCPIPVRPADDDTIQLIQPTVWESQPGCVHALMRSNMGFVYRSDSPDYGQTWCEAYPIHIPNNHSGIDCAMTDHGLVLVCNPVGENWGARSPLSVFISQDNGITFEKAFDLETQPGEFSYPSIVCRENRLLIVYTHNRKKIAFCEVEL